MSGTPFIFQLEKHINNLNHHLGGDNDAEIAKLTSVMTEVKEKLPVTPRTWASVTASAPSAGAGAAPLPSIDNILRQYRIDLAIYANDMFKTNPQLHIELSSYFLRLPNEKEREAIAKINDILPKREGLSIYTYGSPFCDELSDVDFLVANDRDHINTFTFCGDNQLLEIGHYPTPINGMPKIKYAFKKKLGDEEYDFSVFPAKGAMAEASDRYGYLSGLNVASINATMFNINQYRMTCSTQTVLNMDMQIAADKPVILQPFPPCWPPAEKVAPWVKTLAKFTNGGMIQKFEACPGLKESLAGMIATNEDYFQEELVIKYSKTCARWPAILEAFNSLRKIAFDNGWLSVTAARSISPVAPAAEESPVTVSGLICTTPTMRKLSLNPDAAEFRPTEAPEYK